MADHQVYAVFFRKFLETSCFFCLKREGFLDKDMFFVVYNEFGYLEMSLSRGCHSEPIKVFSYRFSNIGKDHYIRILLFEFGAHVDVSFYDSCKTAETMQGLYMILTPAAGANDTYFLIHKILLVETFVRTRQGQRS